ncbi:hypothetical protein J4463_01145 [Candidatus Pacearchaeota archaeon]|nr:hypothetical protein [Candidatus Pacearchaeota archaeon]
MREEHSEQIERWANYIRENPEKWKSKLKPFLDAQIIMARRFYSELMKTEKGRQTLLKIKEMKMGQDL